MSDSTAPNDFTGPGANCVDPVCDTCSYPGGFVCDTQNPTYQTYGGTMSTTMIDEAVAFANTQINYMKCKDKKYSKHFCPKSYTGDDGPPCFLWKENNNTPFGTWNIARLGGNYSPCCLKNTQLNGKGERIPYPWENWTQWADPGDCFIANEESCLWNSQFPLTCNKGDCYISPVAGTSDGSPSGTSVPDGPTSAPDGYLGTGRNNSQYTEWWIGNNWGGGMSNKEGISSQCYNLSEAVANDSGTYSCTCDDNSPCTGNAVCKNGICVVPTAERESNGTTSQLNPGRCVYGNWQLRAFCEDPKYRQKMLGNGGDPPGFDFSSKDTVPYIYNVRNGQCYMSLDYCHQINEFSTDELKAEKEGFTQCMEEYIALGIVNPFGVPGIIAACNQPWSWDASSSKYWENINTSCKNFTDADSVNFGKINSCSDWNGIGTGKAFNYACVEQKSINEINTKAIDKNSLNKKGKMMCINNKLECSKPAYETNKVLEFVTSMTIGTEMFMIITGQCDDVNNFFNGIVDGVKNVATDVAPSAAAAGTDAVNGVIDAGDLAYQEATNSTETFQVKYDTHPTKKYKRNVFLKSKTDGKILTPYTAINNNIKQLISKTDELIFNIDPRYIKKKTLVKTFKIAKMKIYEVIEWRKNSKHSHNYSFNYMDVKKLYPELIITIDNTKYVKITKKQAIETTNKDILELFAFMVSSNIFYNISKISVNNQEKVDSIVKTLSPDGLKILREKIKSDKEIIKNFIKEQNN